MPTVKGVNRTKADDPASSENNIMDPGAQANKIYSISDTYEAVAVSVADIIEMGQYIPKGAYISEVTLMADALGGSVTLAVGDYEDPDRYILATAMNTGNKVVRLNAIAGRDYKVDDTTPTATGTDRQLIITVAGAAATGTIWAEIKYRFAQ